LVRHDVDMNETKSIPSATTTELLRLATDIVAAYVSNNAVSANDLPEMIRAVHSTLSGLDQPDGGKETDLVPAVPIKKSVTADHIICLEDGKKLKMLKRYLRSQYGMTPEEYRARWNLPHDYPMVAPNYAAQRSKLAKQIGLGRVSAAAPAKGRRRK
jgi:predicted transcriptional regulator